MDGRGQRPRRASRVHPGRLTKSCGDVGHPPGQLAKLEEAQWPEAGRLDLQLMIPHHQASPSMAAAILVCTEDPAVTSLAPLILTSQQSESSTWKSCWPPPLTPEPPRRWVRGGESSGAAQEAVLETC